MTPYEVYQYVFFSLNYLSVVMSLQFSLFLMKNFLNNHGGNTNLR